MKRIAFLLMLVVAPSVSAVDQADLDGTQIFGSRELPKVLYIVPWKQPLPTELVGRPSASLLDEALSPIDRAVFEREVRYHSALHRDPKNGSRASESKK